MAKFVLTDQLIFADDYDLTGDLNAVALNYGAELKDCTTYQDDTRNNLGGLKTVNVEAAGFYSPDDQDLEVFANVGLSDKPVSIAAQSSNVGDVGYFFNAVTGSYSFGESIGEITKFNFSAGAQGDLIRGVLAHNARETVETTTGDGSAIQLGTVSSSQKLYAVLHVLESGGSGDQTLDIIVESDDNGSFTSGTTQLTFTQVTSAGTSEIIEVSGAITDDYFRAGYTIAGSGSPSFKFVLFFGVQ